MKVTLTLAKDGEGPDEVVTLVQAAKEAAPRHGRAGAGAGRSVLWVREMLGELGEDDKDVEYVPPATCLDSSLDYGEVGLFVW